MVETNTNAQVTQIELVEDSIILNEEFKKNVAIPYFKDIYRDLVSQSDQKTKGINKITMLTVRRTSDSLIMDSALSSITNFYCSTPPSRAS